MVLLTDEIFRRELSLEEQGMANFEKCRVKEINPSIGYGAVSCMAEGSIEANCPKLEDQGQQAITAINTNIYGVAEKAVEKSMSDIAGTFGKTICGGCDYAGMGNQLEVELYRQEVAETRLAALQARAEVVKLTTQFPQLGA